MPLNGVHAKIISISLMQQSSQSMHRQPPARATPTTCLSSFVRRWPILKEQILKHGLMTYQSHASSAGCGLWGQVTMLSILMLIHERNACHSLPVSIGLGNALKIVVFFFFLDNYVILENTNCDEKSI